MLLLINNQKEKIDLLNNMISNIEEKNYKSEFINGGISYSEEITCIFNLLMSDDVNRIIENNREKYSYEYKKKLDQEMNIEEYSIVDCFITLDWLWYLEGSGRCCGIINKRIEQNRYVSLLKRLRKLLEEYNYPIE